MHLSRVSRRLSCVVWPPASHWNDAVVLDRPSDTSMSSNTPAPRICQFDVGVDTLLERQDAIFLAAAKALGSLDRQIYRPYDLLLIDQRADRAHDGWMRLSGSRQQEFCVFLELVITRVYRWFRLRSFRI